MSPLSQYNIDSYLSILIGGLDFSVTSSTLYYLISLFVMYFIFSTSLDTLQLVPARFQSGLEQVYSMLRAMVVNQLGITSIRLVPLIITIFMVIFVLNLIGLIPHSFSITSQAIVPIFLSFSVFLGFTFLGFVNKRLGYLSIFLPQGVPAFISPFVVLVEVISYLSRSLSLGLRLFANMFAGHTLLNILGSFTVKIGELGGIYLILAIFPFFFILFFSFLELLVCFLQSLVFVILVLTYLEDTVK